MTIRQMRAGVLFVIFAAAVIPAIAALLDPNNPTGSQGLIMIDKGAVLSGSSIR